MNSLRKSFHLSSFVVLSLVVHTLGGYALSRFGSYDFTCPVDAPFVAVDFMQQEVRESGEKVPSGVIRHGLTQWIDDDRSKSKGIQIEGQGNVPSAEREGIPAVATLEDQQPALLVNGTEKTEVVNDEKTANGAMPAVVDPLVSEKKALAAKGSRVHTAVKERLSYQVSLFGMPVGQAVLEAATTEGEIRITLAVQSNAAFSGFYPVDDFAETRLIGGKFIVSRVRQREGPCRSDTGFTLCLAEKTVVWVDRMHNLVAKHPLENEDVLDVISGFYYFRTLPVEVGKAERLSIFDNNRAASIPIEVLRRERVRLPGLREANTLVIHPVLQTDGLFRGDMLIWLTDDENKVPVKLEMGTAIGRITAELVSAEAEGRPRHKPDN